MQSPRALDLPFDDWRPGQRLAIRVALHSKRRHVVIQAPTGFGKTGVAGALTKLDPRRQVILTATKGLQAQYRQEVPGLADIRGMANYECLAAHEEFADWFPNRSGRYPVSCDRGPCRSGAVCSLKENGCTYFDARRMALASQAVLTNYAYWLSMRRFAGGLGNVHRLILDEAHAFPEELMAAYRIEVPLHWLDVKPLPYAAKGVTKRVTWWKEWAARRLADLAPREGTDQDLRVRRHQQRETLESLGQLDGTWAWDVTPYAVVFEPTVPRLLFPLLAHPSSTHQVVYLSATITPGTLDLVDIDRDDVQFHVARSRFPVERRPVYVVDAPRVDHRMTDTDRTFWLSRIDQIIRNRLDRKGLVHSVSYERAALIKARSKHNGIMLAPRSTSELAAALERFRRARPPMILVSPAITTGYNFPYTDAEYQVIAKLPFADTRSHIAQARIRATEGYRDHLTAQTVVQTAGRIDRADDDQGETFIVDGHARWFLPRARELALIPEWFDDAVEFPRLLPVPPSPLT